MENSILGWQWLLQSIKAVFHFNRIVYRCFLGIRLDGTIKPLKQRNMYTNMGLMGAITVY